MNIFSFRFLHMWLKTLLVIGHNEHSRVILGFHGFMSFTATASILLFLSPAISVLKDVYNITLKLARDSILHQTVKIFSAYAASIFWKPFSTEAKLTFMQKCLFLDKLSGLWPAAFCTVKLICLFVTHRKYWKWIEIWKNCIYSGTTPTKATQENFPQISQ